MSSKKRALPYPGPVTGTLRSLTSGSKDGHYINSSTNVAQNVGSFAGLKGTQYTESEGHPNWYRRDKRGIYRDVGGPFTMTKKYVEPLNVDPVDLYGSIIDNQIKVLYETWYNGPVLPMGPTTMAFPPDLSPDESSLTKLGTNAIARCSPSNAHADTSVFIKELISEGFPHLFLGTLKTLAGKTGRSRRKALGDAYLNKEFGIDPLVADIKKMSQAIMNADAIMRQYERDSGRAVRRKYYFPEIENSGATVVKTNCSPWYNPSGGQIDDPTRLNRGKVIRTDYFYRKTWFSGAFSYYVPTEYGFTSRPGMAYAAIQARKVHGLSLTPDVIWNTMPWSWAVDWFTNTSEVLSNVSDWAIDNQVLLYGYIMQHTLQKYTYTFVGETGFRNQSFTPPSVTFVTETKVRRGATPFGFGLDSTGFSNRQKAIVAALGLSKVKSKH